MLILVMDVEQNTTKTEKIKKQEFSLYRPGHTGLLGSFFCVPSHLFTVSKSINFTHNYFQSQYVLRI